MVKETCGIFADKVPLPLKDSLLFFDMLYKLSKGISKLYWVFISFGGVDYLLRLLEMSLVLD